MRITVEDAAGGRVTIDGGDVTSAQRAPVWDGDGVAGRIVKADASRRFTLTLAYPADRPDRTIAADGYRDFAAADTIEQAAWNYLTKSPHVGLWHADGTEGAGRVVESYIWRADPWVVKAVDGSEYTVHPGDWLLGIQWNEQTWPLVGTHIKGVSMQGKATRRKPSPQSLANLRR